MLRDLLLFFRRDLRIASSYRSPFVLELIEALFGAATFYYVARFVDSPQLREALPQGTSYFAYSLVGFVFFDYLHAALDSFDRSLEEARDSGTLEPLLVTQVSLPVILIGSGRVSLCADDAARGGLPWLGSGVIWLSVRVGELACGCGGAGGHASLVLGIGNFLVSISVAVQARKSRRSGFSWESPAWWGACYSP